jgi:ABC-type polysaccharide/polyol phosphate export permease
VSSLRRLFAYRELLRNLVRRDLVERYQRSPVGILLSLAVPIVATVVLSLFFHGLMPGRSSETYALRARRCAGTPR